MPIMDGWQVENTDKWLRYGNPWEIHHAEWGVEVKLGGFLDQPASATRKDRAA